MINPKLITLAREFRSKTQSQLSKEIAGLSQGNLSRIEKGILNITEEILGKIANNLNFPKSFFKQTHVKTPINEFYYRKRISIPKKKLLSLEALLDLYRMSVDILLESIEIPEFRLPQYDLEDGGTPELIARKVRQALILSRGPIDELCLSFEKNGIVIIELFNVSEKFDGITTLTDGRQPIIFINGVMPNDRKRFTLAHELGHLIMHIPFTISNNRDEEKEANRFAAEFSMPELDSFNEMVNLKFSDLSHLKRYWKMSMAFIIMRARSIKSISESKAKNFIIELSRRGWRKKEPINVELDSPKLLNLLIRAHIEDLNYSENELQNILNVSEHDYFLLFKRNNNIISLRKKYN